jgi:Tol biopolymer transport system component
MMVIRVWNALWRVDRRILWIGVITVVVFFTLLALVIWEVVPFGVGENTVDEGEYLIYLSDSFGKGQLMFYDLAGDVHMPIMAEWDVGRFAVSVTNRLAFSSAAEGENGIYILDYPFTDSVPLKVTSNIVGQDVPVAWSRDGRYLAYLSAQADGVTLFIWDGEDALPIYHSRQGISELTWGPDGRLAFTDFHLFDEVRGEVVIWDGYTTTSVSQNPAGEDRAPAWSGNGRLAFLSEWQGNYDIFVWDGVTKAEGVPDRSTFTNVASTLTDYGSDPVWTNAGLLAFGATGPKDDHIQIYEWDGKSATNISQHPSSHTFSQSWRSDGYWAFATPYYSERRIYVRDEKNQTRLTADGQYSPAWSESGQLMFCAQTFRGKTFFLFGRQIFKLEADEDHWSLFRWDGEQVIEVVQGDDIWASWPNGEGVFCTHG